MSLGLCDMAISRATLSPRLARLARALAGRKSSASAPETSVEGWNNHKLVVSVRQVMILNAKFCPR